MIKAVIFDMDGVVIDSEKYWPISDRKYYESIIPDFDPARLPNTMGMGNIVVYGVLKALFSVDISAEQFSKGRTEAAKRNIYTHAGLMPGFRETITELQQGGLFTALASSSPREIIDCVYAAHPDLHGFFNATVTADDVNGRTKPFPDIFLKAAESLGVDAAKCLVIEDADHGIQAGKAAGMQVFGFRNGINEAQTFKEADMIFRDFSELLPHLSPFFSPR